MKRIQYSPHTVVLVLAALAILTLVFLEYLLFSALQRTSTQITLAKTQSLAMQLEDKVVSDFKLRYHGYEENLQKMDWLFVDSSNPVEFITFLESVSADANVQSDINIAPHADAKGEAIKSSIIFQVYVHGGFSQILKFSEKLEAGPYLVKITSVTIKNWEQRGLADKKTATGDLEAYLLIEALPK